MGTSVIEFGDFLTSPVFDDKSARVRRIARRETRTKKLFFKSCSSNYLLSWLVVLVASICVTGIQYHRKAKLNTSTPLEESKRTILQITSEPSNADVFVDGIKLGETPLTAQWLLGFELFNCDSMGFVPSHTTVVLGLGTQQSLAMSLVPENSVSLIPAKKPKEKAVPAK